MAEPMLKIDALQVRYGAIEALKGISLEVHAGEVVTIIGGNGAGKSTLMKTISGLEPAFAGSIHFEVEHERHCNGAYGLARVSKEPRRPLAAD